MHRLTLSAVLLAALALTACGGTPSATVPTPAPPADEVADDTDDGALDLVSRTFDLTRAQARSLGLGAQMATAPLSVTLAVKIGSGNLPKRAALTFRLNGKDFPADLTGTTAGTYTLALNDTAGALLGKSRAGTVMAELDGTRNTTRSRSTAYVPASSTVTCAVATFTLTLPGGAVLSNGPAPLQVCESAGDAKNALLAASSGLLYTSESDYPWTHVQLTTTLGQLPTPEEFGALVGMTGPNYEVEVRDFAELFTRLTTVYDPADPVQVKNAKQYEKLRKVFTQFYEHLRVYRIHNLNDPAVWRVYVLGTNAFGLSGLWTTSIET